MNISLENVNEIAEMLSLMLGIARKPQQRKHDTICV